MKLLLFILEKNTIHFILVVMKLFQDLHLMFMDDFHTYLHIFFLAYKSNIIYDNINLISFLPLCSFAAFDTSNPDPPNWAVCYS
jgi:hypothetical protein